MEEHRKSERIMYLPNDFPKERSRLGRIRKGTWGVVAILKVDPCKESNSGNVFMILLNWLDEGHTKAERLCGFWLGRSDGESLPSPAAVRSFLLH